MYADDSGFIADIRHSERSEESCLFNYFRSFTPFRTTPERFFRALSTIVRQALDHSVVPGDLCGGKKLHRPEFFLDKEY